MHETTIDEPRTGQGPATAMLRRGLTLRAVLIGVATTVVTDGRAYCNHVLDHQADSDQDWVDRYKFEAAADHIYEIETLEVESDVGHAIPVYLGDQQPAIDDAGPNQSAELPFEPDAAGHYYIKVYITADEGHVIYCLKVTGAAAPETTDVIMHVR